MGRHLLPLLASSVAACGSAADLSRSVPGPPVVVLVVVDTLRADHLGFHGYGGATSPHLDDLARRSVVFTGARSPSSWTMPAVASLFTSRPPRDHGIWRWEVRFSDELPVLAEAFRSAGYHTAAVVSHHALLPQFGFDRGFSSYDTSVLDQGPPSTASTAPDVTARVLALLTPAPEGPAFLVAHYFDPHAEYVTHDDLPNLPPRGPRAIDRYDGEVAWTDAALAPLLARMDAPDLVDRSVLAVTADHGEEFLDHRGTGHGHTLFDELIRVPLLVRAPGLAPATCDAVVSTMDVGPTLLSLAGVAVPPGFAGAPLVIDGRSTCQDRVVVAETRQRVDLRALVDGRWKLVEDRKKESVLLFDLDADPGERASVAESHPEVVQDLQVRLDSFYAVPAPAPSAASPVPAEAAPALRELGYLDP